MTLTESCEGRLSSEMVISSTSLSEPKKGRAKCFEDLRRLYSSPASSSPSPMTRQRLPAVTDPTFSPDARQTGEIGAIDGANDATSSSPHCNDVHPIRFRPLSSSETSEAPSTVASPVLTIASPSLSTLKTRYSRASAIPFSTAETPDVPPPLPKTRPPAHSASPPSSPKVAPPSKIAPHDLEPLVDREPVVRPSSLRLAGERGSMVTKRSSIFSNGVATPPQSNEATPVEAPGADLDALDGFAVNGVDKSASLYRKSEATTKVAVTSGAAPSTVTSPLVSNRALWRSTLNYSSISTPRFSSTGSDAASGAGSCRGDGPPVFSSVDSTPPPTPPILKSPSDDSVSKETVSPPTPPRCLSSSPSDPKNVMGSAMRPSTDGGASDSLASNTKAEGRSAEDHIAQKVNNGVPSANIPRKANSFSEYSSSSTPKVNGCSLLLTPSHKGLRAAINTLVQNLPSPEEESSKSPSRKSESSAPDQRTSGPKPQRSWTIPSSTNYLKSGMAAAKSKFETGGGGGSGSKPSWKKGASGGAVTGAAAIKDAMLAWCQSRTRGYPHAEVTNFSSSWANGMAFCAIIHSFAPEAIDYQSLNPKARRKNFDLAFKVADEVLGAAPLLDTEDMIAMGAKPDWKCVFTYVQSLYRHGQIYEKRMQEVPQPASTMEKVADVKEAVSTEE